MKLRDYSDEQVKETVQNLGLDAGKLNQKQIDLLSLPLHLGLLAEISQDATITTLNFETANDLFDKFWEFKQRKCRERIGLSIKLTQVIDKLCDYMNRKQKQSLSAPKSVIDEYWTDAEIMISENILIQEDKNIRFFHEAFFDYVFARRFTEQGKELLSFLREDEQHLFKRAQVRQILHHERDIDFEQYLNDIEELLNRDDIRFHLKQLVISLLSNLENPTGEEWKIIQPFMIDNESTLVNHAWGILYQPQWFMLAKDLGIIEQWLRNDNDLIVDNTVRLISFISSDLPNEIPPLIEPFIENSSEKWMNQFLFIAERIVLYLDKSRNLLDLFLTLLNKGKLDNLRDTSAMNGDFWSLICSISDKNSAWTCEIIGHYLNRRLELYLMQIWLLHWIYQSCLNLHPSFLKQYTKLTIGLNPFDKDRYNLKQDKGTIPDTQDTEIFRKSADKAPKDYVVNVLPFMLSVIELTANINDEKLYRDNVWHYRNYDEVYGIKSGILKGMEIALSNLARNNPEEFTDIIEKYDLLSSDFETIQFLLLQGYIANVSRFADKAAEYVLKGFQIALSEQVIKAITPYCSDENFQKIEQFLLNYYPEYEKSYQYIKRRGYAQLILLNAIPSSQLTPILTARLKELHRKFPDVQLTQEECITNTLYNLESHLVKSPIPENATEKMTDEQWLEGMKKYDGESQFNVSVEYIGGAAQLFDNLKKEVIKNPLRFAKLINQFPDNTNLHYFNAILRGVAETEVEIDIETVLNVCQRCHQLPKKPCGSEISWLMQKLAYLPWDERGFDIITYYALHDPNPEQEFWQTEASSGNKYYGGDILTAGINSVRGKAVEAIAQLIFKDKERTAYFKDTFQQIVKDPSLAVRSCVAVALTAVLNYDRELAINLFKQLVDTEEILLSTHTVDNFLYYALGTHYTDLKPIVERMINSQIPEVQEVGARSLFLGSLINSEAQLLAEKYLSGTLSTPAHRKAAAFIYIANLPQADHREFCEQKLIELFNDTNQEVQEQAARFFSNLEPQDLNNYPKMIESFINSSVFLNNSFHLLRLFTTIDKFDEQLAFKVCQRFVDIFILEGGNRNGGYSNQLKYVSQIIVQIYSQTRDSTLQSSCLDVIDNLYRFMVYGLDKATQEYDR